MKLSTGSTDFYWLPCRRLALVDQMMSRLHELSETGPVRAFLIPGEVAERSEQYGEAITEMRANPPSPEEIELVMNLRVQESGWTIEQTERLLHMVPGSYAP